MRQQCYKDIFCACAVDENQIISHISTQFIYSALRSADAVLIRETLQSSALHFASISHIKNNDAAASHFSLQFNISPATSLDRCGRNSLVVALHKVRGFAESVQMGHDVGKSFDNTNCNNKIN